MRKLLMLASSAMLLLSITACSNENNSEDTVTDQNEVHDNQITDETPVNDDDKAVEDDKTNENEKAAENQSDIPDEIADYDEAEQLATTIDELGSLQPDIKTDNPNKRIILFADDNHHKQYKSIYIKNKHRLKIIDLNKDEDDLLFNDII